ncbi:MAG: hypothetical protein E6J98_03160 [Methanobacteriota archaeon]|nr:MAG: hypothetical protein E6J98_03160 [Euryarchaeota archaeon]
MKRFALIIATTLLMAVGTPFLVPVVAAQTTPIPTLSLTIVGETNNSKQVFSKNLILLPELPYNLVITFHNGDPVMAHSFTIADVNGTPQINSLILNPGAPNVTLSFTVLSLTRIAYNGTQFTPQPSPAGGILFYCIPHQTAGMVGRIALAGLAPPPVEKGILLRAYWIGLIGIAVTLLWVVISYYIIKSSSHHFKDHAEHVRRGLP